MLFFPFSTINNCSKQWWISKQTKRHLWKSKNSFKKINPRNK